MAQSLDGLHQHQEHEEEAEEEGDGEEGQGPGQQGAVDGEDDDDLGVPASGPRCSNRGDRRQRRGLRIMHERTWVSQSSRTHARSQPAKGHVYLTVAFWNASSIELCVLGFSSGFLYISSA